MRAERNLPCVILGVILAVWVGCSTAAAAAQDDLYRAQATVTGQGEANRLIGFATCLEYVLIKVSGAIRLEGDPRLERYKKTARDFVRSYSYRDQKLGKPKGDEQGTRDRPYDLTVEFDEKRIDKTLQALGLKPWRGKRPVLAVFVEMQQGRRGYIVRSDLADDLPRAALFEASQRRGMQVVLPPSARIAGLRLGDSLTPISVLAQSPVDLGLAAIAQGGDVPLAGRLEWDDQELSWASEWRLDWKGGTQRWKFRAVTFDEAFRRAIGGAAEILSGAAASTAKQAN